MLTEQDLFNMAKDGGAVMEPEQEQEPKQPIGRRVINTVKNVGGKAAMGAGAVAASVASLAKPATPQQMNPRYNTQ